MNVSRIYQGKVARLELENEAGQFEEENPELLWDHARIFNIAVNYHALCLLSLATSEESEFFKLRQQIEEVWNDDFIRDGDLRPGMKRSIAEALGISTKEIQTVDSAIEKVRLLLECDNPDALRQAVLDELLQFCRGESGIRNKGNEMLPRLCDPGFHGGFEYDAAAWKRKQGEHELKTTLHDLNEEELSGFAKKVELSWVVNLSGAVFEGESAKRRLEEAFSHFEKPANLRAELRHRVQQPDAVEFFDCWQDRIASLPDNLTIPRNNKGAPSKIFACLLFRHFPHPVTQNLLISFPNQRLQNHRKTPFRPVLKTTRLNWRGRRLVASSTAVSPACQSGEGRQWRPWTGNGRRWMWPLERKLSPFSTRSGSKKKNEGPNGNAFRRMQSAWSREQKSNPRMTVSLPRTMRMKSRQQVWQRTCVFFEAFQKLVGDLKKKTVDPEYSSETLPREYLSGYVVRGFREVFALWNAIADAEQEKEPAKLTESLRKQMQEWRKSHLDKLGWALLLKELADEGWQPVWRHRKDGDEIHENRFLENYVKWCGALAKSRQLEAPVRFTPADPLHSRRLPRFTDMCNFKPKGRFHHNPGELSVIVPIAYHSSQGWEQRQAKLTYSAPRMLRDGLRNPEKGERLGDEPWASPLWKALLGEEFASDPAFQDFSDCSVQLMPKRHAKSPNADGFLLTSR